MELCTLPLNHQATEILPGFPDIHIKRESSHIHMSSRYDDRKIIVGVPENQLKRITTIFFEEGFVSCLKAISETDHKVMSLLSKPVLYILTIGEKVAEFFRPHLKDSGIEGVEKYYKYLQTREYKQSCIRSIRWHPNFPRIAVASNDDTIRIYTCGGDQTGIVPLLKCGLQKEITSLAWRPFSAGELAVGCQTAFLIWNIDPNSLMTRPLSQAATYKYEGHCPVTSLEFNSNGSLLATSSLNDSNILIWDVDQRRCQILKRISTHSNVQLKWSANANYLCSSTLDNVFRIWNTERWMSDKWCIQKGFVQSFEFSPCGKFLLFVTSEDSLLYNLRLSDENFFNAANSKSGQALPIADLTKINVGQHDIGGQPKSIIWNGMFLAITFKDTNSVVIYHTNIQKYNLNVTPACYLNGLGAEYPSFIAFQPHYEHLSKLKPTILCIGWSTTDSQNGRIQYFPLM